MAVVTHRLKYSGPAGDMTAGGGTYKAVYQIDTNDPLDGPVTIRQYVRANIADFGDSYVHGNDSDGASFLKSISVPPHVSGSAKHWDITLNYEPTSATSIDTNRDENGDKQTDPKEIAPQISVRTVNEKEAVDLATYRGGYLHAPPMFTVGQEYAPQNSATEIYDPPLDRDRPLRSITIKHRVSEWDDDTEQQYVNAVNSEALEWRGWTMRTGTFERYTLKVNGVSSDLVFNVEFDAWEWDVTLELLHDPKGWRVDVPDRGLKRLARAGDPDGRGGLLSSSDLPAGVMQVAVPLDHDGVANNGPVNLDGRGRILEPGQPIVFATWQIYDEDDIINLPVVDLALQAVA